MTAIMLKRLRSRGDTHSWVMLSDSEGFVRLPGERILYNSPPRVSMTLDSPRTTSASRSLSINSSAGSLRLTNQRVVYLPATPTDTFQSFSAPILNLHDTHVSAPFFGPNVWSALVQPVAGGGIPPEYASGVELKFVFKEGGAFDFHSGFERIKERLSQALETASQSGTARGMGGVNLDSVHLDQLPAYEEARASPGAPLAHGSPPPRAYDTRSNEQLPPADGFRRPSNSPPQSFGDSSAQAPPGPPPGYEEVQRQSVAYELERRLMRDH